MITWEEKFATGIAELDKQHKNLFQYTNDLEDLIRDNAGSRETVETTMTFLERYIESHFGREETCMFKFQCPVAGKNKEAHQKFITKFRETQEKIRNQGDDNQALQELHEFLETWLVDHIGRIDTQLKPCVH
jgi:hemerythrin